MKDDSLMERYKKSTLNIVFFSKNKTINLVLYLGEGAGYVTVKIAKETLILIDHI